MAVEDLPIFCYYDRQRFMQFGSMDCANWYGIAIDSAKKQQALYPCMGRRHVTRNGQNKLVFNGEPRAVFKSINFFYVIVGTQVIQYDRFLNSKLMSLPVALTGNIWFAYLTVGTFVYCMLTDGSDIFVITEDGTTATMTLCTDSNAPVNPTFVAAFGNRFVVSDLNSPRFTLSQINLGGVPIAAPNTWFTPALFAEATGIIRQFGVLHGQLYIFNDFSTDIWANIATQIRVAGTVSEFPWKLNSSYNWDYGIADPFSLSVDFGRMAWLAQNSNGLVSFMASTGDQPRDISTQAINVLLERSTEIDRDSPFLEFEVNGFLYQYENTVFYRVSAGRYIDYQELDINDDAASLEYNFETSTWQRVIELNGERNRIQKHIYFANKHLVTVTGDTAMYEMAGNIYHNELRTPDTTPQAINAFTKYPMRYELVTRQLFLPDYAEFIDDYIEIDFVFGDRTFYRSCAPFLDTVFMVDEDSTTSAPIYLVTEDDAFIIDERTNLPSFDDNHYCALFKPHIELYYSDDGGITFLSADAREFSALGEYRWRMRWYELGASRNRCYRLICVSSAPIVILGGVRNTRRASGGAN